MHNSKTIQAKDYFYWNQRTYGNAIKIQKKWLRFSFVFFCLVTPFTNWMIPFVKKVFRNDLIFRY